MSTASRVAKNTGYLYAKMSITMFISLYTTRLVLNSLGDVDFGIFNIVGGAIAMLGFLNATMARVTQRYMSYSEGEGNKDKQKKIFNISIVLHAAISILVGVVLLVAGYFFFHGILNIPPNRQFAAQVVYGSLIVSTMFTVMSVPYDAMLNAHENMRYYAIVGILESLLKLTVAFAVVYTTSDKLIIYGVLMAAIPFITLTIMRIYCHRKYTECIWAPRRYFDRGLMKEMFGFAGWNFISTTLAMVGLYGQGLVLNYFFGPLLNAAYGIVNQLNGQLLVLSNNMLKALNPVIVKNEGAKNRHKMLDISLFGNKLSFFLLLFPAIPFIIEAPTILKWWLKSVPEWTVLFLYLCLAKAIIEQLFVTLYTTVLAQGNIKGLTINNGLLYIISLIFSAIMFSIGASPAWLYISSIIFIAIGTGISRLYYCKKLCGLSISTFVTNVIIRSVLLFTVVFGISFGIKLIIPHSDILQFLCVLFTSSLLLLLGGYTIMLNKAEKELVRKSFIELRNRFTPSKT